MKIEVIRDGKTFTRVAWFENSFNGMRGWRTWLPWISLVGAAAGLFCVWHLEQEAEPFLAMGAALVVMALVMAAGLVVAWLKAKDEFTTAWGEARVENRGGELYFVVERQPRVHVGSCRVEAMTPFNLTTMGEWFGTDKTDQTRNANTILMTPAGEVGVWQIAEDYGPRADMALLHNVLSDVFGAEMRATALRFKANRGQAVGGDADRPAVL